MKKYWFLIDKEISSDHYEVKSSPNKKHKFLFDGKPNSVISKLLNLNLLMLGGNKKITHI